MCDGAKSKSWIIINAAEMAALKVFQVTDDQCVFYFLFRSNFRQIYALVWRSLISPWPEAACKVSVLTMFSKQREKTSIQNDLIY